MLATKLNRLDHCYRSDDHAFKFHERCCILKISPIRTTAWLEYFRYKCIKQTVNSNYEADSNTTFYYTGQMLFQDPKTKTHQRNTILYGDTEVAFVSKQN